MEDDEVLIYPSSALLDECENVSESDFDNEVNSMLKRMHDIVETAPNAVAVAAPQIGINLRAFYVKWKGFEEMIINPKLRVTDLKSTVVVDEGCLSLPGWYFKVRRPAFVTLDWVTIKGEEKSITSTDPFLSRIFQHEIDHLDGILVPYYMSDKDFNKWERYYLAGGVPNKFRTSILTASMV